MIMASQVPLPTCGATNRAGTPCQRRDLHPNGRCRLHGGLSTGPTSAEGKARVAENLAAKPREGAPEALPVVPDLAQPDPVPAATPEPIQADQSVKPRMTWAETVALFERWKAEGKRP